MRDSARDDWMLTFAAFSGAKIGNGKCEKTEIGESSGGDNTAEE